ncbi:hypothetical protein GCM10022256_15260 [Frondihabitans peucedani]|uniref:Uncharacterized protein n=1 Tax=Frondihabitans peucedani TaxID=598626 RepID=A0ABP8E1P1_9MICO
MWLVVWTPMTQAKVRIRTTSISYRRGAEGILRFYRRGCRTARALTHESGGQPEPPAARSRGTQLSNVAASITKR